MCLVLSRRLRPGCRPSARRPAHHLAPRNCKSRRHGKPEGEGARGAWRLTPPRSLRRARAAWPHRSPRRSRVRRAPRQAWPPSMRRRSSQRPPPAVDVRRDHQGDDDGEHRHQQGVKIGDDAEDEPLDEPRRCDARPQQHQRNGGPRLAAPHADRGRERTHHLQDEADQQQRHGLADQHRGHVARDVQALSRQRDGNQEQRCGSIIHAPSLFRRPPAFSRPTRCGSV